MILGKQIKEEVWSIEFGLGGGTREAHEGEGSTTTPIQIKRGSEKGEKNNKKKKKKKKGKRTTLGQLDKVQLLALLRPRHVRR